MANRKSYEKYWRSNLRLVLILLIIWAIPSFGCGIFGVNKLDEITLGGFPLGFWFAQQGSIYIFVVLILIYAVAMDKLDRRFEEDEKKESAE